MVKYSTHYLRLINIMEAIGKSLGTPNPHYFFILKIGLHYQHSFLAGLKFALDTLSLDIKYSCNTFMYYH